MSYGTRKAIAGTQRGEMFAAAGVEEAVRRYACQTVEDIRAVLAWAKARGGWWLRTADDDERMKDAYLRAVARGLEVTR